jgi:hypothetical protein
MKKLIILAALASTVVFAGCERKETVVVPAVDATPSTTIVPVPVAVPGPKGDTGAMGATGATGSAGSTTVIVPPAAPAEAPK